MIGVSLLKSLLRLNLSFFVPALRVAMASILTFWPLGDAVSLEGVLRSDSLRSLVTITFVGLPATRESDFKIATFFAAGGPSAILGSSSASSEEDDSVFFCSYNFELIILN